MKDVVLEIVKNNIYHVKSPSKGEVIRFFVNKGDEIDEGDVLCLLKSHDQYLEITSQYQGVVNDLCVKLDEEIGKWSDLVLIDVSQKSEELRNFVDAPNSLDYNILYTFQQNILPNLIYREVNNFLRGIALDGSGFIYFLLKEFFENNNMTMPFKQDNFSINEEIIANGIILIEICWPELSSVLLTKRSYIFINPDTQKIQYFTSEKGFDGEMMLSSIVPVKNELTRYNYGVLPSNPQHEKEAVVRFFLNSQ